MATPSVEEAGREPGRMNLRIVQGGSFALPFTVSTNGTPKDLSGYTVRSEIRDTNGDLVVAFDMATGSDLPNGLVQFNLTIAQTDALDDCATYFYDLYLETGTVRDYILTGVVNVTRTRSDPP